MTQKNPYLIENKKSVEEVSYLEEKNQLPNLSEITDESGKVKLPDELIDKLRDPNARFDGDLVVFPFYDDSSALIVARCQPIVSELNRNYPTIVRLFDHNRKGTLAFLKANGAVITEDVVHDFDVRSGSDSSHGPEVWKIYKQEINNYVDKLCRKLTDQNGNIVDKNLLSPAREVLSEHIHKEYYKKLPTWPFFFSENSATIWIEISGSYRSITNYYVVWSCSGSMYVRDENRGFCDYHARFSGRPDMKILILNYDKLGEMERDFSRGIEDAKRLVDKKEIEYGNQGKSNLLEYWDKKYI